MGVLSDMKEAAAEGVAEHRAKYGDKCTNCGGRGSFEKHSPGLIYEEECFYCGGTGRLEARDVEGDGGESSSGLFATPVLLAKVAFVVAVVVFTIGVPISMWMNATDGTLRPLLEILPSGIVADTPEGSGQPILVGLLVLAGVAGAVYGLSMWRRSLIRRSFQEEIPYPALLAVSAGRMVVIVFGVTLAFIAALIAGAADLKEPGEGALTAVWQIGFALVGIGGLSYYGLKHRIEGETAREKGGEDADEGRGLLARALRRAG